MDDGVNGMNNHQILVLQCHLVPIGMDDHQVLGVKSPHLLNLDGHLASTSIDGRRVLSIHNHQVLIKDGRQAPTGVRGSHPRVPLFSLSTLVGHRDMMTIWIIPSGPLPIPSNIRHKEAIFLQS